MMLIYRYKKLEKILLCCTRCIRRKGWALCIAAFICGFVSLPVYAETAAPASSEADGNADSDNDAAYDEYDEELETEVETSFGGSIEAVHGVQLVQPFHYTVSKVSAELFTEVSFQNTRAKISGAAAYNRADPLRTGFRLREAYGSYQAEQWELCVGRQFIAWGQADGFRLTDRITAYDMREVSAGASKNLPSDAIRFRFLHDIFTFDTLLIPFFTADMLPPFSFEYADLQKEKPPFTISLPSHFVANGKPIPLRYHKRKGALPKRFIDSEFGARLSFYMPYVDVSVSGFYGWDKTPRFMKTAALTDSGINITLTPEYYRIGSAGFDAAASFWDFVFRFEAACIFSKYFEPKLPFVPSKDMSTFNMTKPIKKNQYLMLAGIDWNRENWTISMQYFEDLVFGGNDALARGIHEGTVSISLSKRFLQERLKLSAAGLIGVNHGDTAGSYTVSYALSDLFTLSAGADVYTKGYNGEGRFAAMSSLTAAWLKGSFTF